MHNPFEEIAIRLSRIEDFLYTYGQQLTTVNTTVPASSSEILNVTGASSLLGVARQTVYSNISKIPHFKRHGRLYFRKEELIDYLESGRVKGGSK